MKRYVLWSTNAFSRGKGNDNIKANAVALSSEHAYEKVGSLADSNRKRLHVEDETATNLTHRSKDGWGERKHKRT
jgi:hypothetical protein